MIWDSHLLSLHSEIETPMRKISDNSIKTDVLLAYARNENRVQKPESRPMAVFNEDILSDDDDYDFESASTHSYNTFIMRWNPEISSHKIMDFENAMASFFDCGFYYEWSIHDYKDAHVGDNFFMIKVGQGNTGIVMAGIIDSEPFRDIDWSGQGREVWYVRMIPNCMIHPDNTAVLLTTEKLSQVIPGVDWGHGHSGEMLNNQQSKMLDALWRSHLVQTSALWLRSYNQNGSYKQNT